MKRKLVTSLKTWQESKDIIFIFIIAALVAVFGVFRDIRRAEKYIIENLKAERIPKQKA